jgi:hypothetical protein
MFIGGVFLILLSWILIISLIGILIGIPILIIGGVMVFVSIFIPENKIESHPANST